MLPPSRENAARWALTVFAVGAVAVTVLDTLRLLDHLFFLKGLPVWALCAWVALRTGVRGSRRVIAGLFLGSLGDIALGMTWAYPPQIPFVAGLSCFLAGHLCYIAAFAPQFRLRPARLVPMLAVAVLAAGLATQLTPRLGPATVPVLAYLAVISVMAITALGRRSASWEVGAGALVFLLSDGLIAVNVFVHPIARAELWVFATYFAAQGLIAHGWVRDAPQGPPGDRRLATPRRER